MAEIRMTDIAAGLCLIGVTAFGLWMFYKYATKQGWVESSNGKGKGKGHES